MSSLLVEIAMIREDLENLPKHSFPEGYHLRAYRPGDDITWLRLWRAADELLEIDDSQFRASFGEIESELVDRLSFLCDPEENEIGTTAAWYGPRAFDKTWGRIHWFSIIRSMQGKGLAKPFLKTTLDQLKSMGYQSAFLSTNAPRIPAIRLYLQFGFRPWILKPEDKEKWLPVLRSIPDLPL